MHSFKRMTGSKRLSAFILGVLILLLIAGCSSDTQTKQETPPLDVVQETEATNAEQTPETEVSETQVVAGLFGEIEIPTNPQRIAGLTYAYADHLIALGLKPHSIVTQNGMEFPDYLKDRMEGVIPLGQVNSFDKEVLLSTNPDLILANQALSEHYDQISKIAPTYMTSYFPSSLAWFKNTAKVLGKEQEAEVIVNDLMDRAKELGERVAASDVAGETVMIFRLNDKLIQLFAPSVADDDSFYSPDMLYDVAGIPSPDYASMGIVMNEVLENISLELLPQINPDHIFLILSGGEALNESALKELRDNSLWRNLTAVQNDNVYTVDNTVWIAGFGPVAYNLVLDQVEEALLD